MARQSATFGQRLRQLRHDAGLTLEAVADRIGDGASKGGISHWELDDYLPEPHRLPAIAAALAADLDELRSLYDADETPMTHVRRELGAQRTLLRDLLVQVQAHRALMEGQILGELSEGARMEVEKAVAAQAGRTFESPAHSRAPRAKRATRR